MPNLDALALVPKALAALAVALIVGALAYRYFRR
jgi:hypothetical protein